MRNLHTEAAEEAKGSSEGVSLQHRIDACDRGCAVAGVLGAMIQQEPYIQAHMAACFPGYQTYVAKLCPAGQCWANCSHPAALLMVVQDNPPASVPAVYLTSRCTV